MSDRVQELLREFAQVTTPETSATPTFQQHGNGHTIVHITGNIDAPVTVLPLQSWQPIEDTLGRLLRQAKPWAYRWTCLYGVLAAALILLRVAQVWSWQGSLSAADAWLRQHDYWFVCKDMLAAAIMASVTLVCWRAIAGPSPSSRPSDPQSPDDSFKRDSKAFEDVVEPRSTSQPKCQNREDAASFRKPNIRGYVNSALALFVVIWRFVPLSSIAMSWRNIRSSSNLRSPSSTSSCPRARGLGAFIAASLAFGSPRLESAERSPCTWRPSVLRLTDTPIERNQSRWTSRSRYPASRNRSLRLARRSGCSKSIADFLGIFVALFGTHSNNPTFIPKQQSRRIPPYFGVSHFSIYVSPHNKIVMETKLMESFATGVMFRFDRCRLPFPPKMQPFGEEGFKPAQHLG